MSGERAVAPGASEAQRQSGLRIEHLSKTFPGTRALVDVSLGVERGEVLALLGHNGSGKSTVIKVLAGFHQPDPGASAWVDGEPLELGSSQAAKERGLRFVHQDLGLIAELNAIDNIALSIGYTRDRSGRIAQGEQVSRTKQLLGRFGVELDVTRPLSAASPVQRTSVAIARAMWDWDEGPRVLVLDEPTAALPTREVARLFDVIREVRAAGHAVVYVSHRMDEIFEVADRVVVLRNGHVAGEGMVSTLSSKELSTMIAGQELAEDVRHVARPGEGDLALRIRALRGRYLAGVDVEVRRGEVLGLAGLLGSGRDELPYAVAGAVPSTSDGPWLVGGRETDAPDPVGAAALGIGFVPAERARQGLIADMTVGENLTLTALPRLRVRGAVTGRREAVFVRRWLTELGVLTDTADRSVATLSGGNQQRVLLARCLAAEPSLLVLAEPTAGVDVAARQALYELVRERAREGLGILVASSDTEDLVRLCDRVVVLRNGVVADEMSGAEINAERIVHAMEVAA